MADSIWLSGEACSHEEGGGCGRRGRALLYFSGIWHPWAQHGEMATAGLSPAWTLDCAHLPFLINSSDLTPYSSRTLGCHFDKPYKLLINSFPGKEKCLIEASYIMCYPWGGKQPITDFWSQTQLCEFQLHFLLVLHPWAISLNFLRLRVLIYKVGIMSFELKTL